MRRSWALLPVGLGLGLGAGLLADPAEGSGTSTALQGAAIGLLALGVLVAIVSGGDAPDPTKPAVDPARPTLAGLGERVEDILRLANEQADDQIRAAREEAARIVAEAKMRAGEV
ncbi:MAG: hypothetical protein ABW000_03300 [Actinoplanes sp.]